MLKMILTAVQFLGLEMAMLIVLINYGAVTYPAMKIMTVVTVIVMMLP